MEWAGSKEGFGNTPENKNRSDLSKLNPGGFRFQAMVQKHHGRLTPSFPKRGLHLSFGNAAPKFGTAICCSDNAVLQQRLQPSWTNNSFKSGLVRFADRRLRSNPKKPEDIKAELASI